MELGELLFDKEGWKDTVCTEIVPSASMDGFALR